MCQINIIFVCYLSFYLPTILVIVFIIVNVHVQNSFRDKSLFHELCGCESFLKIQFK